MKYKKIIPILLLSVFYPCLSQASDRPEDVIAKADLAMSRVLTAKPRKLGTLEATPRDSADEMIKKSMEEAGFKNPIIFNKDLIKQQEEFNVTLFNNLNAGISLLSDYLYLAMTDKNLSWTRENSWIFNKESGQKLATDEVVCASISLKPELGTACVELECYTRIYEIERQKLCLLFSHHLDLLKYWKTKIFPNSTPRSYIFKNAIALLGQIVETIEKSREIDRPQIEGINARVASESLIEVHQKIMDSMPERALHMATWRPSDGKSKVVSIEKNMQRSQQWVENQAYKFAKEYVQLMTCAQNMHTHLKRIQFNDKKIEVSKSELATEYKKFQELRLLMSPKGTKINHFLNLSQILCPRKYVTVNYKQMEELPELIQDAVAEPALAVEPENTKVNEGEKETEITPPYSTPDQDIQEEITYDDDYWRAEHQRHQQRKGEILQQKQSSRLSQYETNLYTYLQETIFKNGTTLKVQNLKHDLKAHKFDVKANTRGNGSVYNVSPSKDNPLFAGDWEYSGAYFNVHLPSDNIPIPYDYFRYLRSGFSNVFGLTLDYITAQLNSAQ